MLYFETIPLNLLWLQQLLQSLYEPAVGIEEDVSVNTFHSCHLHEMQLDETFLKSLRLVTISCHDLQHATHDYALLHFEGMI